MLLDLLRIKIAQEKDGARVGVPAGLAPEEIEEFLLEVLVEVAVCGVVGGAADVLFQHGIDNVLLGLLRGRGRGLGVGLCASGRTCAHGSGSDSVLIKIWYVYVFIY